MAKKLTAKPPTLSDVARRAGVSVPTASRVLNGGVRGVESGSTELRQRVQAAARALGYAANPAAQTIKGGRGKTLALLVGDIEDQGSATMIAGVMHAAERRGLSVAVRTTGDDGEREQRILVALRGERHLGVILATSRSVDPVREAALGRELDLLQEQGARVVLIGDSGLGFPRVTVNTSEAASALAAGLFDAGGRRFAILAGPADQITSRDRVDGFLTGLRLRGIDHDEVEVVHSAFSRDGGYDGFGRLGTAVSKLDVVAAMSDAMAVGAMVRAREAGLQVPSQIEISGFDHAPMISDLLPFFSTVEVPLRAFGEAAVSLVVDSGAETVDTVTLRAEPLICGQRLLSGRPASD
ncbi:LacI family DNA-binding transcriptional regulator [Leifsonia aquatica]|uniref:LacI family DNA-binding transcriptional regulator n=1 Tax=Leifsonia aquatica TaxID=144185 RepID=UPI000468A487|nr:LacI family DNA-binding transcriptional regulator [Leifsonia aquatica]